MGIRLLLILLTLWALYIIVRGYLTRSGKPAARKQNRISANTVQCKVCGTYLPEGEALEHRGDFFCSREHLSQQINEKK